MDSDSKDNSKRRASSEVVDNIARNERQKMTLLVEYRHILGDISKELVDESRDVVARTKKLIAKSKKTIKNRKSA